MVAYKFYADGQILGLEVERLPEAFIDLGDFADQVRRGGGTVALYTEDSDIRDLFSAHGCLETCPVEGETENE